MKFPSLLMCLVLVLTLGSCRTRQSSSGGGHGFRLSEALFKGKRSFRDAGFESAEVGEDLTIDGSLDFEMGGLEGSLLEEGEVFPGESMEELPPVSEDEFAAEDGTLRASLLEARSILDGEASPEPDPASRSLDAAMTLLRRVSASDHRDAAHYWSQGEARKALRTIKRSLDLDPRNQGAAEFAFWLSQQAGELMPIPVAKALIHSDEVADIAWGRETGQVFTGTVDGMVRSWSADRGEVGWEMPHGAEVTALTVSPNGDWVASVGEDHVVRVWPSGLAETALVELPHGDAVNSVVFSRNGKRILTASNDGKAMIWETGSGKVRAGPFQAGGPVYGAAFAPDESWVLTWTGDGKAAVWDAESGVRRTEDLAHEDTIWEAAIHPNGKWVATASADRTIRLWDAQSGEPLISPLEMTSAVGEVRFTPDGKWLVAGSFGQEIRFWQCLIWEERESFLRLDEPLDALQISSDGQRMLVLAGDLRIWDLQTLKPIRRIGLPGERMLQARFNQDGTRVATVSQSKAVRIFDATSGAPLKERWPLHQDWKEPRLTSSGRWLVAADREGKGTWVWQLSPAGEVQGKPRRFPGQLEAFSQGEDYLVLRAPGRERFHVANLNSKAKPVAVKVAGAPHGVAAVSPTGDRLAFMGHSGEVSVVNVGGDEVLTELKHPGGDGEAVVIHFSPDGEYLLTAGKRLAMLWDLARSEKQAGPVEMNAEVTSAGFDGSGKRFFVGDADGDVKVWRASDEPGGVSVTHFDRVETATFSKSGDWLITGARDGLVQIHSTVTGGPRARAMDHGEGVNKVTVSADGSRVLTLTESGILRQWDAESGRLVTGPAAAEAESTSAMGYSADGSWILAADPSGCLQRWPRCPENVAQAVPVWLEGTVQLKSGLRIWDDGVEEGLHQGERDWVQEQLLEEPAVEEAESWEALKAWSFGPGRTRNVHPLGDLTLPEYLLRLSRTLAESKTLADWEDEIRAAYHADPSFPLMPLLLAGVAASSEEEQHLRRYAMAGLPESCDYSPELDRDEVCALALKICRHQGDEEQAALLEDRLALLESS